MAKKQTDGETNNVNKYKIPSNLVEKNNSNTENKKSTHGRSPAKKNEPIGVNLLSYNKKGNWQPTVAIIVSIFAVGVSVWLAIVTYRLYNIAADQAQSTKTAATIADNTFKAAKFYNDSSLKIQEKVFTKNDNRSKRSLDAQIASLKETQKDFEIENRPYIQFQSISIDTLKIGVKPIIRASIGNLGKYPAKIFKVSVKVRIDPGKALLEKDFTGNEMVSDPNVIIANNTTMNFNFLDKIPLSEDNFKYLTTGKESFFISGKIYYINFLSKKKVINNFIYKIDVFPSLSVVAIKNNIK